MVLFHGLLILAVHVMIKVFAKLKLLEKKAPQCGAFFCLKFK